MSIRLRKTLFFVASFFIALAAYWPSMQGTPIWDDLSFWFLAPEMQSHMSYIDIWLNFGWPFSVTVQKFMLSVFGSKYIYYHLTNFIIHFANSLLIYKLGRLFRLKYPLMFFALFLLHPVCVISTAWMVQIKTLLCLFFALATILTFVKGQKDLKWMVFSWVLFAFSITSKSASITLPVIFVIMNLRLQRFNKLYLLIPFFLLSGWSTYRVLKSPVTFEGSNKAAEATKVKEPEAPKVTEVKKPEPQPAQPVVEEKKPEPPKVAKVEKPKKPKKPKKEKAPKKVVVKPEPRPEPKPEKPEIRPETAPVVATAPVAPKKEEIAPPANFEGQKKHEKSYQKISNFEMILQTLHYYFWQSLIPTQIAPIKGLNYERPGVEHYVHIFFLLCLVLVLIKDSALLYLGAAHFLLLPFLGIIPAPFMNITWVSDQHLYLVLPCLIGFWLRVVDRIKWKYAYAIPTAFLLFFTYQTYQTTPIYKDQFAFYESSLDYNPTNVPVAYNLAFAKIMEGELIEAETILDQTMDEAEKNPLMKKNRYYPFIVQLKIKMTPTR